MQPKPGSWTEVCDRTSEGMEVSAFVLRPSCRRCLMQKRSATRNDRRRVKAVDIPADAYPPLVALGVL